MKFFAIIDPLSGTNCYVSLIPNAFQFKLVPHDDDLEIQICDAGGLVLYSADFNIDKEDEVLWKRIVSDSRILIDSNILGVLYDDLLTDLMDAVSDIDNTCISQRYIVIEEDRLIEDWQETFDKFMESVVAKQA
jgi:hypothetical protein